MKVRLTRDALVDLDDIAHWIARDDADRAEAFVQRLRRQCATLATHPRRHPIVPLSLPSEVRKLAFRGYLIFYRIADVEVQVLRIVHGARDWAALLAQDPWGM